MDDTSLINAALRKIGSPEIAALDDGSAGAEVADALFEPTRNAVQRITRGAPVELYHSALIARLAAEFCITLTADHSMHDRLDREARDAVADCRAAMAERGEG